MARLDPELRYLLDQYQASVAAGTISEAALIEVMVYYTGDIQPAVALGLTIDSYHSGMVAGHLQLKDLEAIASQPNIQQIDLPKIYRTGLHESIKSIGVDSVRTVDASTGTFTGFTGKGVIVGIIDSGIDYRHKAFQVGGKSRILRIWDQLATFANEPSTGKKLPTLPPTITTSKGVEYTQKSINDALANANPLSIVGQMDIDGHGTHVAGIAAGNGSQKGSCHGAYHYIGVAPEADLIIVKTGGNDPDLLTAIDYIVHHAGHPEFRDPPVLSPAPQRVVINISLYGQDGSHDGKTKFDGQINDVLLANPSTLVIVTIAGNDGAIGLHAQASVPATSTLDLDFEIMVRQPDAEHPYVDEFIEIWFDKVHTLSCAIKPSNGSFTTPVNIGGNQLFPDINNGGKVLIDGLDLAEDHSDDNRFYIKLIRPAGGQHKAGIWTIKLTNPSATPVPVHAWIPTSKNNATGTAFKTAVSHQCTIGGPGSAEKAITVGSYRTDTFFGLFDGDLSDFSGRGPMRDGAFQKPDLVAPGDVITAPGIKGDRTGADDYLCFKCCCDCCADFYVGKDGTSQAAPHVTGAVALMWQKDPTLTAQKIKELLTKTARKDGDTGSTIPNPEWGFGKLDVAATLAAITTATPAPPVPIPAPTPIVTLPHRQLADLQERFMHTIRGTEWRGIIRTYAQEVNNLINSNKRVATVWHRSGGPAWVRVAFQMAATPTMPLPDVANGHNLQTGIDNMLAMLKRYGSAPLVAWLTQNEPDLALLEPGRSLLQLLDSLDQPVHAV